MFYTCPFVRTLLYLTGILIFKRLIHPPEMEMLFFNVNLRVVVKFKVYVFLCALECLVLEKVSKDTMLRIKGNELGTCT